MLRFTLRARFFAQSIIALIALSAGCNSGGEALDDDLGRDAASPHDELRDSNDENPDDEKRDDVNPDGEDETPPAEERCDLTSEYLDAESDACAPHSLCPPGEAESVAPTATTDRLCASCAPGDECLGGLEPKRRCGWLDHDADPSTPCAKIASLVAGGSFACALFDSGDIRCWGFNQYGVLDVPVDLGPARALSAAHWHVCAIRDDEAASVRCWGKFQAGDHMPPADLGPARLIHSGISHACVLLQDGELRCWGDNSKGKLIVPSDLGAPIISHASDGHGNCVALEGGSVRCWGGASNLEGAALDALPPIKTLYSGGASGRMCGLLEDGSSRCWGINMNFSPEKLAPDFGPIVTMHASSYGMCAIDEDGELLCGRSTVPSAPHVPPFPMELGPASLVVASNSAHCVVLADREQVRCVGRGLGGVPDDIGPARDVQSAGNFICALLENDRVRCWGADDVAQSQVPDDVNDIVQLKVADRSACAVNRSGELRCWGAEIRDMDGLSGVVAVDLSSTDSCALLEDGDIFCSAEGPLGETPIPDDLEPSVHLAVGDGFACALAEAGAVRCWGAPGYFAYGEAQIPSDRPKTHSILAMRSKVCILSEGVAPFCWWVDSDHDELIVDFVELTSFDTSGSYECGIKAADSTVVCRGPYGAGWSVLSVPDDLGPVTALSTGSDTACAVAEGGSVRCWGGNNHHGELNSPGPPRP